MEARIRYSLQHIQELWDTRRDMRPLDNLVKAFRAIQDLPPDDPDSYFAIASAHGEPFRGPGVKDSTWWGGYCNHANVLFPTWHRAYLLRLENSLRNVQGCENVTIPYWDEYARPIPNRLIPNLHLIPNFDLIPGVLTSPDFPPDSGNRNPLFSYKLQRALSQAQLVGANNRYTKPQGYETVRFPLSGLVGTPEDQRNTARINAEFPYPENITILNTNVANWLEGTAVIKPDGSGARIAENTSIRKRLQRCLEAPNYTVFSNTASQNQWINEHDSEGTERYVVSLESPHNGMHLALGGFYQAAVYDANPDPYKDANGDMGCNETAGFDPIFYFHHCFIDYVFWVWQKNNGLTDKGSLEVIDGYDGTVVTDPVVGYPPGTLLDMTSPLYPFRKPDGSYFTSHDVTDIMDLGYDYAPGSMDTELPDRRSRWNGLIGLDPEAPKIALLKRVSNINRAEYKGSFIIKAFINIPGHDQPILIGAEPILSRWSVEGCGNCQNNLDVQAVFPVDQELVDSFSNFGDVSKFDYVVKIKTLEEEFTHVPLIGDGIPRPVRGAPFAPPVDEDGHRKPIMDDLL